MHTCTMNVPVLHLERFDSIKSAFMFLLLLPSSALLACTLRLWLHSSPRDAAITKNIRLWLSSCECRRSLICVVSDPIHVLLRKTHRETTGVTVAAVWAQRSFGCLPGSDHAGGRCRAPLSSVYSPSG